MGPQLGLGVVVVVGDGYKSRSPAKKSPPSVDVQAAATVCSPPAADAAPTAGSASPTGLSLPQPLGQAAAGGDRAQPLLGRLAQPRGA